MFRPENLIVVPYTNHKTIHEAFYDNAVFCCHFTNGIYALPQSILMPTILGGFQFVTNTENAFGSALCIILNTDKSTQGIYDANIAALSKIKNDASRDPAAREAAEKNILKTLKDKQALEPEIVRANKVCLPLAQQFPNRKVFALFFDEPTPNNIFYALNRHMLNVESLFKWGYGTGGNTGVIEGEEHAKTVFGFPFANDDKPIADLITRKGYQPNVIVLNLAEIIGPHGLPYVKLVGKDTKCLFPLNPEFPELLRYGLQGSRVSPQMLGAPVVV